jgi:hypothetical protein
MAIGSSPGGMSLFRPPFFTLMHELIVPLATASISLDVRQNMWMSVETVDMRLGQLGSAAGANVHLVSRRTECPS